MRIGPFSLSNPVVAAPLAGITDQVYRPILKEHGAALLYSEMVSSHGLHYLHPSRFRKKRPDGLHPFDKERELYAHQPEEEPFAVQIFGVNPQFMAEAARIVAGDGADIVDINMGCPAKKVTKGGAGSALMRTPRLAAEIMRAVREAVDCPVTVKIRSGWDGQHVNATEIAHIAEAEGIAAVVVHARTRDQQLSGRADWRVIADVKQSVNIPVIGNGDVRHPPDARRMLEETNCDAVMVGRGILGNPWLIRDIVAYLSTGQVPPPPTVPDRFAMLMRHARATVAFKGEYRGIPTMRKHALWYVKGLPLAAVYKPRLSLFNSLQELEDILEEMKLTLGYRSNETIG